MTSTGNAVGMEASLEAGMHNENTAVEAIGRLEELARLWDATGQEKWALGGSGYIVTAEEEPAPVADFMANPDEEDWKSGATLNMALARARLAIAAVNALPGLIEALRHSVEREAGLREALVRQTENMSFVLNRVDLGKWGDKFEQEIAEDRAALDRRAWT